MDLKVRKVRTRRENNIITATRTASTSFAEPLTTADE